MKSWSRVVGASSTWLFFVGVLCVSCLASCLGGGGGGGSSCEQGAEGCECFGNDTCLDDLECLSGLCVDPDAETDEGDTDSTARDDAGTTDQDDGTEATDDVTDGEATDTPDDTTDAATDTSMTDVSETDVSETDVTPTDETEPTDVTTDVNVTDEPVVECAVGSGTCAAGNGLDCTDGQLVERDCSACALLGCGTSCCGAVWPLAADAYPYVRRDDLITEFSVSSASASISASFESGEQFAAIGFELDASTSISPGALVFDADTSGSVTIEVSLERNDETGCQYSTSGGALLSELYCWGTWEDVGYGGSAAKILVRMKSLVSQSATLTVYGVSF